jgi:hypothetical protein
MVCTYCLTLKTIEVVLSECVEVEVAIQNEIGAQISIAVEA